ncbi:phage protein Gp36 family protein [Rhodococcus sp. IEGM 1374]|uniref:phage protein Gp36 family protein n=1 Tax=Rhodococcus sp. IEGM 1374 TaxID=3082221 RepID=UPI002954425F|nr:phage protein Gp36 family protein [Rhodococcus sp. IEGM 1374]MDV7992062.1 phage protein Gp36 family protein [Rhodococcus sp. IEGM 1374]
MSTTLAIESFSENNLRERTTLTGGALAGDVQLLVDSTQGYEPGQIIYVGQLSREGCEKAVIAAPIGETTLSLSAPLARDHARSEPVTAVLGDLIHVYRAANINGTVPVDAAFTVLATRSIDPDQLSTYYTDSAGNSNFWYRNTYYNATTNDETALKDSTPTRGDDFGHYASLSEIRKEAGFENAYNLSDTVVDQQRRAAEAEINLALGSLYTVPFVPVPDIVNTLTVKLAAAMLIQNQYPGSVRSTNLLRDARLAIKVIQDGDQTIVGEDGTPVNPDGGVRFWPDETAYRAFHMGDRF